MEHPSIDQIVQWMRYCVPSGDPGEANSVKLLRFNQGFYEVDKVLMTELIDDFEKVLKISIVERPGPLTRVGMHLLLDQIGYDPKKYTGI
jgi:hypothetical protein